MRTGLTRTALAISLVVAAVLARAETSTAAYYPSRVADGVYEIQPRWTSPLPARPQSLWLAIQARSTALGARVVLEGWSTHSSLRWRFAETLVHQPGGVGGSRIVYAYRVTNLYSGKCLDIKGPTRANYVAVHQWDCKGYARNTDDPNASQLWKVTRDNIGTSQLINAYGHRCLDIPQFRAFPGRLMQIWSCSEGWNQAFRLKKVG